MRSDGEVVGRSYCPNCEEWVEAIWADWGIGPYEYWGSKSIHHDWVVICPHCFDEIEDYEED